MKSHVRIAVLGDPQVGKTSIITSLISGEFRDNLVHCLAPVTISPDVTPDRVTTYIVDTPSRSSEWSQVEEEIGKADSVILVYAVDQAETFNRIETFWLPEIRRLRGPYDSPKYPSVIIVGNKVDVRGKNYGNDSLEQIMRPLLKKFPEVETVVECSAKSLANIEEVFFFAQRSVLYPSRTIYDQVEKKLQTKAAVALRRIFHICSSNKREEVMNDADLKKFQERCFKVPLTDEDIQEVKGVIARETPQGVNAEGCLTKLGFLSLQHMFIKKGRMETVWAVLREFGYGDDLNLTEEYLQPVLTVEPGHTTELSSDAISFFTHLFQSHDDDSDGALSPEELENLFAASPGHPWGSKFPINTHTNPSGYVTLKGFLAQWSLTTFTDYKVTLRYLAYLGYENDRTKAITVTRGKEADRKTHKVTRKIYQAYTFGAAAAGKTSFLNYLVDKPFTSEYVPTTQNRVVAVSVPVKGEADRYLLVHEFANDSEILSSPDALSNADIIYLLYDSQDPRSFQTVTEIYEQLAQAYKGRPPFPVFIVGTKAEHKPVQQNFSLSPEQFAVQHRLPLPHFVSAQTGKDQLTFLSDSVQAILLAEQTSSTFVWIGGTLFLAVLVGAGVYYYKTKK